MSIRSALLGLIAAVALTASAAQADVLTFTYNDGTGSVGGVLDGTLQPDHNTFVVTGNQGFFANGVQVPFAGYLGSADTIGGYGLGYSGNGTGTVTLDGSYMDLLAWDTPSSLAFTVNDLSASTVGNSVFASGVFDALPYQEPFNPSDWHASLAAVGSVPEPATLAVFGFALAGFGAMRRRKRAKA